MKIAERADIEMWYIKRVQSWINDLNMKADNSEPSDRYLNSEVMTKLLGSMRTEAAQVVENRQRVYNILMSEQGPYNKLKNITKKAEDSQVRETELEFHKLFNKRNSIAKTYKKYNEAREHISNQIEALESQLSQRSRITSSRRPTSRTGPRKIDEMRDRLSSLRCQNDSAAEKIASFEEELLDEESSAKKFLSETERCLKELEEERMKGIISEIRRYLQLLQQQPVQRSPGLGAKGQPDKSLDAAEGLLKVHWLDVHTNATRGDIPDFRDMFGVPSVKSKQKKNAGESKQSDTNGHHETGTAESVPTYFSSYKSSSGSSVDGDVDSILSEVSRLQSRKTVPCNLPTRLRSQESIETLKLPPEVRCPADISVLEPNRQYTTRMKVSTRFRQDNEGRQVAHLTEYSPVNRFVDQESESDEESDVKVGTVRNVRVIAIEDNTPPTGSKELTFKKGQIIKQKTEANENGFCYGWTRENRVGRKQYGYYKQHQVKLFRKTTV